MKIDLDRYRIRPGKRPDLGRRDSANTQGLDKQDDREKVEEQIAEYQERLRALQERLYAEGKQSLLVVLQAMDAAGKDSTVKHVLGGMNPNNVRVWSFKTPTKVELSHDFLWRVHKHAPGAGYVGVFNRSHYEDVLIVKVHGWVDKDTIERRYDHINHFEELLADGGTRVVKIMLHVSKEYQLGRFRRRLRKPEKHWKFNPADLTERALWNEYQDAFEIALKKTSTEAAPWFVIPSEERWFRNLAISQLLVKTLEEMDPQFPAPDFDPAAYPPEGIE
ncbi:polyphosphate kinase 2 family protein [Alienimonas chondri]|uniref:Polyphosphate:AMP/ADP phosphotransferase n=1 Tax=Alienimonas chondri TaxID=2681879 RepID=A0ABX1VGQ0_9PLAN|nr:polyphosphate kinase 2 family protein [Alienimonas chondri]NNJ26959.1 Polyphosphate:AMP/ADP phosphotransferase [Alienimonas chondri]